MNEDKEKSGVLYIVATPIGNLGDITLRALETLKSVDLVVCEDTRVTGNLLKHFDIKKPLVSYFQHSKLSKIDYIIDELLSGKSIALVTDAGTPGISDPGQELISKIREYHPYTPPKLGGEKERSEKNLQYNSPPSGGGAGGGGIKIIPISGPSALAAAASISGMIEKELYFAGFLPKKKGRQTFFKNASLFHCPIVIYESALRLERTLNDIRIYFGENTEIFIAREMTKMFEEYWGGKIEEVIADLKNHQIRGEIVLVVRKANK